MRLIDATDDTVTVQKSLLDEIKSTQATIKYTPTGEIIGTPLPPLISIATHRNACKILLRLLSPQLKHLEAGDESILFDAPLLNSKKSGLVKRREHLTYLKRPLIQVCLAYLPTLLRNRSGSRLLEEVVKVFYPVGLLQGIANVFTGLSVVVEGEEEEEGVDEGGEEVEEEEGEEEEEEEEGEGGEEDEVEMDEDGGNEEEVENDDDGVVEEGDVDMLEGEGEDDEEETDSLKKKEKEAVVVLPDLPFHEDPVSHLFLKKILQFEVGSFLFKKFITVVESIMF